MGRAATDAFVQSFLAIIVLNLILAELLNTIYAIFLQDPSASALG